MIPWKMRLEIRDKDFRGVNLWIPLALVWILLLPVALLVTAIWILLKCLAAISSEADRVAGIIQLLAKILWEIGGLKVDVKSQHSRVQLKF